MRKQEIEITISPSGEVSFAIKGVKGASCVAETAFLEDALGGEVISREKTSEYYEQPEGGAAAYQWQGGEDDGD